MAKPQKKQEARILRQQGMAVTDIALQLGVSKSSVSVWTRDIKLTTAQRDAIYKSDKRRKAQDKGAQANVEKHRKLREDYQEQGRVKAREGDPLHLAGCMLYWGEGSKTRGSLNFVNSDANMMIFYMRFLREALLVNEDKISFRINAYLDNGLSEEEIISYWMNKLNLTHANLNKCSFNKKPTSSQQRGHKLIYGLCEITYNSTELMQHIYGAIQEYTGLDNHKWLDI